MELFPVAVEGIRLPWTPGDPSVFCLREEREYGSQLFTIPEPWWLKSRFSFICNTKTLSHLLTKNQSEKWTAEGTPWITVSSLTALAEEIFKEIRLSGFNIVQWIVYSDQALHYSADLSTTLWLTGTLWRQVY